jgi:hypothetical protein
MHADVEWRERETYGGRRSYGDRFRKDRQLQVYPRQRRGSTGNADLMVAGVAGFNPERFQTAGVVAQFVIVVMILVMILDDHNRHVVVIVAVVAM